MLFAGILLHSAKPVKGEVLAKCYVCNKGVQFGHNVSHSKRRTPRMWHPNLRPIKVAVNGQVKRLHICTRCLRTQQKAA